MHRVTSFNHAFLRQLLDVIFQVELTSWTHISRRAQTRFSNFLSHFSVKWHSIDYIAHTVELRGCKFNFKRESHSEKFLIKISKSNQFFREFAQVWNSISLECPYLLTEFTSPFFFFITNAVNSSMSPQILSHIQ